MTMDHLLDANDGGVASALDSTELPLYLSAAALLRSRIERGEWGVGEKLPSIEELARQIPMARLTLRQALASLEKEGIVACRQGRGTFVIRDISHHRRLRVATDWSSLVRGIADGTQAMLSVSDPKPFPKLDAGEGRLAPAYAYFRSVFRKGDVPYEHMSYHIARHVVALDPRGFNAGPVMPRLAELKSIKVASARQTMVVSTADVQTAELLRIPLASPVVLARRIVMDSEGVAIFVNEITYRGDYVRFEVDLLPGSPFEKARGSVASTVARARKPRRAKR